MDARKSAALGAFVVLLFSQGHGVLSQSDDCGLKLDVVDVNSAESPLVLKYPDDRNGPWPPMRKSSYVEIFHPGYLETNCLVRNLWIGGGLVSLSCLNHNLEFPGLENWPADVRTTSLIGGRQGTTFDNFTIVAPEHPSPISFDKMSGPVKCSGAVEPTMKKLSDGKYRVGYQMNALDFVPIFGMAFMEQLTFAHVKLLSTINRRPRIDESKENLRKGPIYKNQPVPSSQLSTKSHLSLVLRDALRKKNPSDDALADDYLVRGQLLSKDDLFYIPEQRATFFFENTDLIWNSVNEGNWKQVGDIVRRMAHETVTDLDVYSGTAECLSLDELPKNLTEPICVPKFLFKIALDKRRDPERGIVFITVNDPSVKLTARGSVPSEYKFCDKKPECDELYPEFSSTRKGYTYCCDLNRFIPWNDIRSSGVEMGATETRPQPSYYAGAAFASGARAPPPPMAPPPPPPMARPAAAPHPTPLSTV